MSLTLPERRRIAIVSNDERVDLAIPLDDTLGEVLRDFGYTIVPGRHVVLGRGGIETSLGTAAIELTDGGIYSIVDLRAITPVTAARAGSALLSAPRLGAAWWMLGTLAVLAAVLDLAARSTGLDSSADRVLFALAFGVAAILSAVVWAVRNRRDSMVDALTMLAPLSLAFTSGLVAIPLTLQEGPHLAVVAGLLGAAILAALLTATVGGLRLRSAAGTTTALLLGLAAVWGITLLLGWSDATAAAVSAGAVPLALRALPSTLVGVPEGYHIDYARFMSNRWSVRGSIPVSPVGPVRMDAVRGVVQDSSARLVSGTVMLSAIAVIMVPIVLAGAWRSSALVLAGTIGLLCAVLLALILMPRHSATPVLRWVPRAAAAVVALETAWTATTSFGRLSLIAAAAALLLIGVIAAAVLVPIGRGATSLGLSRLADVVEWIAIALALPAGLLAADILNLMRGVVAG